MKQSDARAIKKNKIQWIYCQSSRFVRIPNRIATLEFTELNANIAH